MERMRALCVIVAHASAQPIWVRKKHAAAGFVWHKQAMRLDSAQIMPSGGEIAKKKQRHLLFVSVHPCPRGGSCFQNERTLPKMPEISGQACTIIVFFVEREIGGEVSGWCVMCSSTLRRL
jgi:hypothetical protein